MDFMTENDFEYTGKDYGELMSYFVQEIPASYPVRYLILQDSMVWLLCGSIKGE
tara:strand:- start:3732 stop:3893 length:162 start_codon:yes stop_codon:yes gene_type:complete